MKNGKNRTLSICLSDLPKERVLKHANGKMYLNLSTYDYDAPDQYDNDFSVSLPLTADEIAEKKAGKDVKRIFLGNGRIWPDTGMSATTQKDHDDLPF